MIYEKPPVSGPARLRQLLAGPDLVVAPGAFSPLSARLVAEAGFDVVYLTGSGTVADVYGAPDVGLVTMREMADQVRNVANAVQIPVVADADTGYGNALNVFRTVREYAKAGAAALHIEDQLWPKKCGHMRGKRVIAKEEMVEHVAAAVEAAGEGGPVIIARCDAIAPEGFKPAMERSIAYAEAGAEVLFVEAPESMDDLKTMVQTLKGTPLLFNMASSGRTPFLTDAEVHELGFKIMILPIYALLAAVKAMQTVYATLKETGDVKQVRQYCVSFEDYNNAAGVGRALELEDRYAKQAVAARSVVAT